MPTYLTGIQPSGQIHLGNYFGAVKPAIELQTKGQGIYFLADYHALTTVHDPAQLRDYTFQAAAGMLACGLDPKTSILFRQSDVPEVHELSWLLSTVTPVSLLLRGHAYKDKIDAGLPVSHGLLTYPVLMAADILLYGADYVPVGPDQKQHLEFARDMAGKFNARYGEVLKLPKPVINASSDLVPGLDGLKMSKSYQNTIPLFCERRKLEKLVGSITTDSKRPEEPKSPEESTLAKIMKCIVSPEEYDKYARQFSEGGVGYGKLKTELYEAVWARTAPMQESFTYYQANPEKVEEILKMEPDEHEP